MGKTSVTVIMPKITMKIDQKTRDDLRSLGAMGDSFDSVIRKLIDYYRTTNKKKPGR